jgi:hypothetical protein
MAAAAPASVFFVLPKLTSRVESTLKAMTREQLYHGIRSGFFSAVQEDVALAYLNDAPLAAQMAARRQQQQLAAAAAAPVDPSPSRRQ